MCQNSANLTKDTRERVQEKVAEAKVIEHIATYYQMVIVAQLTPSA